MVSTTYIKRPHWRNHENNLFRVVSVVLIQNFQFANWAIFVSSWNENARIKQKHQTNGNRAIWLVYRTDTKARGFWLVKRTLGWKKLHAENFLEIKRYFGLTSYCNTIGQSSNAFSALGFSLAGKRRVQDLIFSALADKTKSEHLPKPIFKVIRKSL